MSMRCVKPPKQIIQDLHVAQRQSKLDSIRKEKHVVYGYIVYCVLVYLG